MQRRPRLEYTGQTTAEILSHLNTHSEFSLLSALRWGIQAKVRAVGGEDKLTDEERLVLAVLALESEVNNGGYRQFFWNSSRRFAPTIVASLRRIDCERTATLTAKAIEVLGLNAVTVEAVEREIQREDEARDAQLNVFDREFDTFDETTDKLLRFVVEQQRWLSSGSLAAEETSNKLQSWAQLLRDNRGVMPKSAQYFVEHCSKVDLDNLPPPRLILPAKELYAKMKPPRIEAANE
ncbi:MAG: DMP19 family protein [Acidobacteriota bacterium]|nr:DMP19 family protein [Acidobacteriota bacterium]